MGEFEVRITSRMVDARQGRAVFVRGDVGCGGGGLRVVLKLGLRLVLR